MWGNRRCALRDDIQDITRRSIEMSGPATLADLSQLPPVLDRRGTNPDELRDELLGTITQAILDAPRSQQILPGPSELGNPCDRALFHKLAGTPAVNARETDTPNWKAQVGTAVHAWLNDTFTQANTPGNTRWLRETRVNVGTIAGADIDGSCDLYDRETATTVDWKTTSNNKLKDYRRNGPGEQYRQQGHLYGRGWTRRGLPVDTVMIVFLPRDGNLADTYVWHEPYSEQIAVASLARAEALAVAGKVLGPAGAALMATVDNYCTSCEWFQPGATDLARACPGDPERTTRTDPILELIA